MAKWVIDAGHGGKDTGVEGLLGSREKDLALIVANEIRRILLKYGEEVVLTRSGDNFISNKSRVEMAEMCGGEYFISIHFSNNLITKRYKNYIYINDERIEDLANTIKYLLTKELNDDLDVETISSLEREILKTNIKSIVIIGEYFSNEELEKQFSPIKYGELIAKGCLKFISKV